MRKLNLIKPKIIGLDELKINIVKIWSDSLINEEYDVNDEISALQHYEMHGKKEGRAPNKKYLEKNYSYS